MGEAALSEQQVRKLEQELTVAKSACLDEKARTRKLEAEIVRLNDELRLKDAVISDLRNKNYEDRKVALATAARLTSPTNTAFQLQTAPSLAPAQTTPMALPMTAAVLTRGVPMTGNFQSHLVTQARAEVGLAAEPAFPFNRTAPEVFVKGERWNRGGLPEGAFRTLVGGNFEGVVTETEQMSLRFEGHVTGKECDFSIRVRAKQTIAQVKVMPEALTGRASEITLFLETERVPEVLLRDDEASFVGKLMVNRAFDRKIVLCVSVANVDTQRVEETYVALPVLLGKFGTPVVRFEQQDVLEAWLKSEASEQTLLVENTRTGVTSADVFPGCFTKFEGLDGSGKGAVFGAKLLGELVLVRVELGQDVRCSEMARISVRTASSGYLARCVAGNVAALLARTQTNHL